MYITASEYALKHGKSKQWVSYMLKAGRIDGARKHGSIWFIPENSPRPAKLKPGRKASLFSTRSLLALAKKEKLFL